MWKQTSREEIHYAPGENTFGLRVFKESWQNSDGRRKTIWGYGLPDAVMVLGLTSEQKVIAIREDRPGEDSFYHLVGETLETGETWRDAARRGLLEETGYQAAALTLLTTLLENTTRSDRLIRFVLATECIKASTPEAGVEVKLMEPHEFWQNLLEYCFTHPEMTHAAANTLKTTTLAFAKMGLLRFR